ncbi:MAG TPA: Nramp family divalent metal transporter [Candidatus Dormibacteraeota bacterium]|jgi:NRAMP (natural resistance-associated macrophage protein)-like metal ion transporter
MKTPPQTAALRRKAEEAIAARRERRSAHPRRFAGARKYLAIIGPGLIVANAGNDAGGIFTYSNTGSKYGLNLLWTFLPILLALIVTQEMVARLGCVTGKGLMDLIRERFGVRWTLFASVVVIVANGGTVLAEFAGIGGALGLLGVPLPVAVLSAALMIGVLVLRANRRLVERVFLAMGLTFVSYIVTAFMVPHSWAEVAHALVVPTLSHPPIRPGATSYTTDVITLIGTTITPYMQLFLQSSIVDKGTSEKELGYARADVISGSAFAVMVAIFIVITTAYTLNRAGFAGQDLSSATDAARALQPLAGAHATQLFAIGLLGASLLAAAVLPLSTAFVVCEAFGAERSVQSRFGEAPLFFGLFILLLATGAITVALLGPSSIAAVAIGTQTLDGVLLPVLLVFILILANDRRLLGRYRNGPVNNAIAGALTVVLSALTAYLVLTTLTGL